MKNPFKPGDLVVARRGVRPPEGFLTPDTVYTVASIAGAGKDRIKITGRYADGTVPAAGLDYCCFEAAGRPPAVTLLDLKPDTGRPAPKESDPSGRPLNAPGAKADAGKLQPSLILGDMARALLAVSKIGTDGASKYTPGGWLEVPGGPKRYEDAQLRHMLKRFAGETTDPDSGSLHLAHEAWNALAKLELYLRAQKGAANAVSPE